MAIRNNYPASNPSPQTQSLVVPVMVIVLAALSFGIGVLWQKVSYLEKGGTANVAGVANVAVGNGVNPPAQAPSDPTTPVKVDTLNLAPVSGEDHILGNKNAGLTWIEYSDFQCPFCKSVHPTLKQMMTEYEGKVSWVFRHFPLASIHPRAQKSAEAAECVASGAGNGAFWKFIDGVFESDQQTALEDAGLVKIASAAGANADNVQACITSGEMAAKVQEDYDSGSKAGISGTPGGFLLDGKGNAWIINGAVPYTTVKSILDKALAN